nr:ABC transporter permease [Acidobacteriota bacterium]
METLIQDLRGACRQFIKAREFFGVAALTLALGIGANTALFTAMTAALFSAVPGVEDAEGLVWIAPVHPQTFHPLRVSRSDADRYHGARSFAGVSLALDQSLAVGTGAAPEMIRAEIVSGNYFELLRTRLTLGRGLTADDDVPGAPAVVVIGHDLWTRLFDADPAVVGRAMLVNRQEHAIVGVAPKGFVGAEREARRSVWLTVSRLPVLFPAWRGSASREERSYRAVARLAPGVTRAQANAEVAAMSARTFDASAGLPPGALKEVGPLVGIALTVTGLVLLIACTNVSNLLLARGVERRREMGLRRALGATRGRVVRQLLTESLALAAVASAGGVLFAMWTLDLLVARMPDLPLVPRIDGRVLLFAGAAAAAVSVITGLTPALVSTRTGLAAALQIGAPAGDPRRSRLQSAFIVAQVGLSLVLLVMAGLFLRSLDKANRVDLGFDTPAHVLAATFDLGLEQPDGSRAAKLEAILDRTRGLPGVTAVSLTTAMPMADYVSTTLEIPGDTSGIPSRMTVVDFRVRPAYFRAIGLRLTRGRDFTAADRDGAPLVAIVNEVLARRAWPGSDAIGRHLKLPASSEIITVVGVAQSAVVADIERPHQAALYLPHLQQSGLSRLSIVARTTGDASALGPALRAAIAEIDPAVPV